VIFLFFRSSRIDLGPTQPHGLVGTGGFVLWDVKLVTYIHLLLRLRMYGVVSPLFHIPSQYAEGKLNHFYFTYQKIFLCLYLHYYSCIDKFLTPISELESQWRTQNVKEELLKYFWC
jgi:hypothetical protein